jgi:hypothetical protein
MNRKFISSIFNIIEFLLETELTITSKQLILGYVNSSTELKHAAKARQAIQRYTQNQVPSLEAIREKSKQQELTALDHLVLKMEFQAKKLDEV